MTAVCGHDRRHERPPAGPESCCPGPTSAISGQLGGQLTADGVPDVIVASSAAAWSPASCCPRAGLPRSARPVPDAHTRGRHPCPEDRHPVLSNPASAGDVRGRDVLLVDDVAGTGQTALTAVTMIRPGAARTRIAVCAVNTRTGTLPPRGRPNPWTTSADDPEDGWCSDGNDSEFSGPVREHVRVTRPGTPMIGPYSVTRWTTSTPRSRRAGEPTGIMNYIQRLFIAERCRPGARVIDVCCGRGLQLPLLAGRPAIACYLGLDITQLTSNRPAPEPPSWTMLTEPGRSSSASCSVTSPEHGRRARWRT